MVKYGLNRLQFPLWLRQSLINGFSCSGLSWVQSGQRISVKCAEAAWNYKVRGCSGLKVGKGDNLQLFISLLLKYEGWLYNIIDDKNFESSSLEPPCTGGLKIPHIPMGTCRTAKKLKF